MRTLQFHGPLGQTWARFAVHADGLVSVPAPDALFIFDPARVAGPRVDLEAPPADALVARLPEVVSSAHAPGGVLAADRRGVLRRHICAQGFAPDLEVVLPPDPTGAPPVATALQLSPSGRFVLARLQARVLIIDLSRAAVTHTVACPGPAGHGSFTRLPSGDEVLFLSAESYMGVMMLDPATGRILHRFRPESGFDFCHVEYALTPDGTRLVAFGCVWAGPYGVRIYDPAPWICGSPDAGEDQARPIVGLAPPTPFPLRLVYWLEQEIAQCGDVLDMDAAPAPDGTLTFMTVVQGQDVPAPGSADDADYREDQTDDRCALLDEIQAAVAGTGGAVVLRRVDPQTGTVVSRDVVATLPAKLHDVSRRPDRRVLLLGERAELIDSVTRQVTDLGAIVRPADPHLCAVSADLTWLAVKSWPRRGP